MFQFGTCVFWRVVQWLGFGSELSHSKGSLDHPKRVTIAELPGMNFPPIPNPKKSESHKPPLRPPPKKKTVQRLAVFFPLKRGCPNEVETWLSALFSALQLEKKKNIPTWWHRGAHIRPEGWDQGSKGWGFGVLPPGPGPRMRMLVVTTRMTFYFCCRWFGESPKGP